MKALFLILLHVLPSFMVSAQQINKTISGVVKDTQNEFLPGAQISLLSASDPTLVQGTATDINGEFEFKNLLNGRYILRNCFKTY